VLAVVLLSYSFAEARSLRVVDYRFGSGDLPPAFDGTRIVLISDLHVRPAFPVERVRAVVDRANALHPDMVVLCGDYVDNDPALVRPTFAALARLRAPLGVFGVLGNHDYWSDAAPAVRGAMASAGIVSLDNQGLWVRRGDARLRLGGVGDLWEDGQDIGATTGVTSGSDFVLLVTHNPDYVERLRRGAVDLALAGHTHGGQITLFGLWAPFVASDYGQRFRSGLVTSAPAPVIVSNGIGTIGPPLRFFAPPQLVVVELHRE
jgi:hypothetical protein